MAVVLSMVAGFLIARADTYPVRTELTSFAARIDGVDYNLETMLYRPDDARRHPLVILSHGRNGMNPSRDPNYVYYLSEIGRALATEGYAVAYIVRRGYGNSTGPDSELQDTAILSGLVGAKDYLAAVNYWRTRDFVLPDKVVLMGQSQGGWVCLTSTTVPMPAVLGVINLSGGTNYRLMGNGSVTSAVQDHWVLASGVLGGQSLAPSLWIYAENDLSISGPTSRRMFNAYTDAGGVATMLMLPPFGSNGHEIAGRPDLFIASIKEFFVAIGFDDKPDSQPIFGPMSGGESVSLGGTAVLTANLTGFPTPVLQWRKNGVALSNGGTISGATRTVLRIANLQASDAGTYTLVATNALGTAVSFPVIVGFPLAACAIVTQPQNATVTSGSNASFTIAATGNPAPALQWQRLAAGASSWSSLALGGSYGGTTSTTLSISSATTTMTGDQFRCVCTNTEGAITSNPALFTVNALATSGGTSTTSSGGAGGGGGGAMTPWFVAVLVLVIGGRGLTQLGVNRVFVRQVARRPRRREE